MLTLCVGLLFSCSKKNEPGSEGDQILVSDGINVRYTAVTKAAAEGMTLDGANADDLIENSSFPSVVKIQFGTTVTIDNPLQDNGVSIAQNGGHVVITATATGVAYEISGTTTQGSLKIYSDKKFKLALQGVTIVNPTGPAINIQSKKRAFVVLADQSNNSLEDGATYASSSEDQKGTFFSEGQLLFSGTGELNVKGNNKHGIVSDDYIRVRSGKISVSKAATDGIHSNDGIFIDGGTFHITAASDGIEAEKGPVIINGGEFTIKVGDDGIAASYTTDNTIDPYVVINGGTFHIQTTEGEGIESKSVLTINNGEIYIDAYDDGINAGKAIYINGGLIVSYSRSNDGIDSNGTLTITGGRTFAIGARSPEAGFDCDNSTFKITGGLVVGVGGSTSIPTSGVSTQASVVLNGGNASTIYSLLDKDLKEIVTFQSPVAFTTLLLSSNLLTQGNSYQLVSVPSMNQSVHFNGVFQSGSFTQSNVLYSFTQSALVTRIGGSGGPGGGRP